MPAAPSRSSPRNAAKMSAMLPKSANVGWNPPSAQAGVPEAVVGRALFRIGEHLVCLRDLAKPLVGLRRVRDVRVQLSRQRSKRALDLGVARVAANTEDVVVIAFGRRHRLSRPRTRPRRTGRARTQRRAPCESPSRSPCATARRGRRPRAVSSGGRMSTPTSESSRMWPPAELRPDVHHRSLRLERLAHELEHRRTPLQEVEQPEASPRARPRGPLRASPGRPADEDLRCLLRARVEDRQSRSMSMNARSRTPSSGASRMRRTALDPSRTPVRRSSRYSDAHASRPESIGSSNRKTRFVTPPVDVMATTMTARRLEREHLDVADRRRLERRRRHESEQPGRPREHVRRQPERVLDLVSHRAQVDAERLRTSLDGVRRALPRTSGSRSPSGACRPTCAGGSGAPFSRAPRARCGPSTTRP